MTVLMRKVYPTNRDAVNGAIEQMAQVVVVGVVISAHDAKLRHIAASNAMARSNAESRALMSRLRGKIRVKPLAPKDLASLVYPGRKY